MTDMLLRADDVRQRFTVSGVVQGVGFRPFVHRIASEMELAGFVGNDSGAVFIEVQGPAARIHEFGRRLRAEAPPLARISAVSVAEIETTSGTDFRIVESQTVAGATTPIPPDIAVCDDCVAELFAPGDRRYRHPFVTCTNCGPRFTIVRDVPYDRPLTTMAGFTMCPPCAREYHDPTDRRFHAQPVCCPECGPRMELLDARREVLDGEAIAAAARLLREGKVLAVKGLGGYHLAVDAGDEAAAAALRARKHREDKPFAVMAATVAAARELAAIDASAAELLTSRHRPIVLLARRPDAAVAASVAPGNRELGVMLPYTPLHHLLLAAVGRPIVLTSGNVSDEPIAFRDGDAFERLLGIADAFLTHDRAIHIRTDDSVARSWRGNPMLLRRSRGYVPEPVSLPMPFQRQVLACGAELKNTFCLGKDRHAFISHHVGDLENYETLRSFTDGIAHFQRLFEIEPSVLAHDLHPDYLSTKYALERSLDNDVDLVGVQHHHAHIASCLADNAEEGPVIGVAFDGTGFGTDGTVWGGEFLLAELSGFRRLAHLVPVPLPGGATAIRQPWRMAVSYLDAAFDGRPPARLDVLRRHETEWPRVASLVRSGVNAPQCSSAGRLFDAVAALLGLRDTVNYEGQAAIELEQHADPREAGRYPLRMPDGDVVRLSGVDIVSAVVADLLAGVDVPVIAARFHNTMAEAIAEVCGRLGESTGVRTVALSGGVFQNMLLLGRTVDLLQGNGFRVLTHSRVPCNDGGISLGQAVVAAAQDREYFPPL